MVLVRSPWSFYSLTPRRVDAPIWFPLLQDEWPTMQSRLLMESFPHQMHSIASSPCKEGLLTRWRLIRFLRFIITILHSIYIWLLFLLSSQWSQLKCNHCNCTTLFRCMQERNSHVRLSYVLITHRHSHHPCPMSLHIVHMFALWTCSSLNTVSLLDRNAITSLPKHAFDGLGSLKSL
jgi:hypothetical protein